MICSRIYDSGSTSSEDTDTEDDSLRCLDCDVLFISRRYLYSHLLHHIQQPVVKLERVQAAPNPPLKITFKNRSGNSFEIVSPVTSPSSSEPGCRADSLDEVPREDDHITAESGYFEGQDEGAEGHEGEFAEFNDGQFDGFGDEEGQTDFEGQDPFGSVEGEGTNSERSSLHGSGDSPEAEPVDNRSEVNFSPNLAEVIGGAFLADIDSPIPFDNNSDNSKEGPSSGSSSDDCKTAEVAARGEPLGYGSIPGAEPTPPPEPSPTGPTEYPKIKIKTTGLFKDPEPQQQQQQGCTITEITDDNPTGDPNLNQYFTGGNGAPCWNTPSLDGGDPLKLAPESDNLLSMFNNEQSNKDLGYSSSSDNEFISLDTFNERNRGAMQLYNSNTTVATSSTSLDSLTGLPMQALAQQVSRLNPSSSNQGMHQQNVLINIQQFPAQPQQPYQPPPQPMYAPHYPPHPGQPPMHQGYPPYQPPNPMYPPYPPAPGYPPQHQPAQHMPPPGPQMGQMQPPQMGPPQAGGQQPNAMAGQAQPMPPPNQMPQPPNGMQGGYRAPMAPANRPQGPRGGPQSGGPRMLNGPRPPMNRAPGGMQRPRAPLVRPRGGGQQPIRGQMRPRMPQNGLRPGMTTSPIKRVIDQNNATMKRKRVDVLTPSIKEDDDCQVICMQPKNTGLPQIESVQGGPESVENSIMKLSDSITLSVRNPPPKPQNNSPQKSDAKAVANVLASRGITVTASGKAKESPTKQTPGGAPTALSLNGSVSIVAKNHASKPTEGAVPTVDLTDDSGPGAGSGTNKNRTGLPYRCDLCPAQYPNALGLNKHRQAYHKTTSGMCELGVPVINLKQPLMIQKLSQLGINHYVPLPAAGADGTYALPIISTKNPGNVAALGVTQMLSLGPVRSIPRPTPPQSVAQKK